MSTTQPMRISPGAMWASAFILAALLILQAGRLSGGEARAEMVGQAGTFTVLTADASSEDVLLVLDSRKELLLVYKVENASSVELYKRYEVPRLFQDARARVPGRK